MDTADSTPGSTTPAVPAYAAPFAPGEMLDEKYRVDRLLSVGGMGAVYLGTHTLLKKAVAIKVLRTELVSEAEMVQRFQREAVAASAIGHPNIVDIKDMGKTGGGVAFLVMEYLEGRSLQEAIDDDGPFPISDACDVACEILAGAAAAHRAGIVHRDLKPANVFMAQRDGGGNEAIKLLDFGIAILSDSDKPDHRLTMTGMVLGTPHYMAPEQARGEKELTDAVDIYAVGVILYEMICKTVPYEADNYNLLIYQLLAGEYVRPSVHRADLPPALEDIILRAMALKPWDRFAGAEDFIDALEPFRSGRHASPSVRIPRLRTRPDQRREIALSNTLSATTGEQTGPGDPALNGATVARAAAESMTTDASHAGDTVPELQIPAERVSRRRSPLRVVIPALAAVSGLALVYLVPGEAPEPATTSPRPAASAPPAIAPPAIAEPDPVPVAPVHSAPRTVTLGFTVTPAEALVIVDGQPVDGGTLELPAGKTPVAVRIEAEGYQPYQTEIVPESSKDLVIPLVKKAPERSRRSGRRGDRKGQDKDRARSNIVTDDPYQ